jgi:FixJ family two-component response regulator
VKSQTEIEESFHAGQTRILEMVATDAPLPDILKSIVLLMVTAMQIGPVAFFVKPFEDEKFIAAVHGALSQAKNG